MASDLAPNKVAPTFEAVEAEIVRPQSDFVATLRKLLMPLASLKLTVALLALGILLVFAGTLAQVYLDIEDVKRLYFRTFFAWIDFKVFFPPSFFPDATYLHNIPGGFYFPGGFTLGGLMFINLLAAHGLRFKVQATGARLLSGIAVIAVGILIVWLIIIGGSDKDGFDADKIDWRPLWTYCKAGLAALWVGIFYCLLKLDPTRKWERLILRLGIGGLGTLLVWLFYMGDAASLSGPSMRILWQVMKGELPALVLLGGCALVFRKRAGIVLLHAGIGLLMVNELVVYALHSEAQFHLREGQSANYASDLRTVELAVVDPADAKTDTVTVVPKEILQADAPIKNDLLPFDIKVDKFLQNASVHQPGPFQPNPATAGAGKSFVADEIDASTGTDMGKGVDNTAAYITLTNKTDGKAIGTYLVSMDLRPQKVEVNDKTYEIALRLKREYRPYTVKLRDVVAENYIGSVTPKDYRSIVHVDYPAENIDRDVHIWMNNPLRFAGDTLYQTSYFKDEQTGEEMSSLAVVKNFGWMIPYLACMIVATGLVAHFWFALTRFLRNRDEAELTARQSTLDKVTKATKKALEAEPLRESGSGLPEVIVPAIAALLAIVVFGYTMKPARQGETEMQLAAFGKLPIVDEGRMKPIDTLARNALVAISNRQTFKEETGEKDSHGNPVTKKQPAIKWLLDVISDREAAMKHKVFRIENMEVQQMLGLPRREGFCYALDEFRNKFDEFDKQADLARKADPKHLSTYQKKVLELRQKTSLYLKLMMAFEHGIVQPDDSSERVLAAVDRQKQLAAHQEQMKDIPPLAAPPLDKNGKWESFASIWLKDFVGDWAKRKGLGDELANFKPNPGVASMAAILDAYAAKDAANFNKEVEGYQAWLAQTESTDLNSTKIGFESFFNNADPFFWAMLLYVLAFVLTAVGWLVWPKAFNRAALALISVVLIYHTAALIGRIYISGRPPVTNLYSSAVFIGWACVITGLVLEAMYKRGIGNAVASVAGFSTLLIAFFLARSGDTFSVLQAVLDTQIWLATHVVCITLGYATTYLAGILGIIYIMSVSFSKLSASENKDIIRMIYGTVCFAILFSFVGTVLGGLWADDSWGRFWGWDPKENGALIIVLWNAIVLHARWGGMVRDRGLAALAVGGNIVTSWSWFGVNELGIGLHNYGFTEGVLKALIIMVLSQIGMIIWACCLPAANKETATIEAK